MKNTTRLAYRIRARVDRIYAARKRTAIDLLNRFAGLVERPYLSMSWGKDSVVTFVLANQVFDDLRVVWANGGKWDEWPDTERVKNLMCERFDIQLIEVQSESVIERYRRVGYFYTSPPQTAAERQSHKQYNDSFRQAIASVTEDCDGNICGLRAGESSGRYALFQYRGPIYRRNYEDKLVCCPVWNWTAEDIWTFHAEYDLPYNELYDCPLIERGRLRNGGLFGGTGLNYGAYRIVKMLYPDLFNEFALEFPEIRQYS